MSEGWAVMARMAVDDTDEMATFPGVRRGWEGRCKGKRKQGGCQRLISLPLPEPSAAHEQPCAITAGAAASGTELSPGC